jgi:hypothetical protein
MNKKTKINRLKLNHETVRVLSNKQLTVIAGGSGEPYESVWSNCDFNPCKEK